MVQAPLLSLAAVVQGLAERGHEGLPGAPPPRSNATNGKDAPRPFRGCCSTYLTTRVSVGDVLWIAAKPSSFRLPKRATTPVVMIGAGTGLAPFRAFVREFRAEKGVRTKTHLYFGCYREDE